LIGYQLIKALSNLKQNSSVFLHSEYIIREGNKTITASTGSNHLCTKKIKV
jgi:hypothetical protein